jgi:Putative auto-transporter adhesin, head GIN domain
MDMPPREMPSQPARERLSRTTPRWTKIIGGVLAAGVVLLLVGVIVFVLTARIVIGSGHAKTESRTVSGFTAVELAGSGMVDIRQTGVESLTVTADDNILPYIQTEVSGGRLRLSENGPFFGFFVPRTPIHYDLTVKDLAALEISGSGEVAMTGLTATDMSIAISGSGSLTLANLAATTLDASISGSGAMQVSGTVQTQSVSVSGSGAYSGRDLASATARVDVSGAGDITVQVSDTLDAQISGSGSVTYYGHPAVTDHVSGSGSIAQG